VSGLTAFQVDVARLFFALPASDGFLLAGGGALLASGLTDRPTHDLEFAIDSAAGRPPVISIVGPTFDPEELAGRKLVALFSRAEARDFADVYVLAQRFDRTTLLQRAHEVDPGFDRVVLAEMMSTLDRFADNELPIGSADVTAVRTFFADWARKLATDT